MAKARSNLSIQVVISAVIAERGISTGSDGANPRAVTRTVGEFEVVSERARLLKILGEHLIPPDVCIGNGTASIFHRLFEVLPGTRRDR